MDTVFIHNLEADAVIGIYDWERKIRQRLRIDLEMSADVATAARTEDINDALNYKTLSDDLLEYIRNSEFQLIETLAENIASIVQEKYHVQWVKLTLHKPDALDGNTDVGVIIERGSKAQSAAP